MRVDKFTSLGAAIVVVAGIGIGAASAAGTSSGVKACVTSHGYLQIAKANGHCPAHTKKVTIAKRGPIGPRGRTGPQGPGARTASFDETSAVASKTLTLPTGDTVKLQCNGASSYGVETITVTPPGATAIAQAYGTTDIASNGGSGTAHITGDGLDVTTTDGHSMVTIAPSGPWVLQFTGAIKATLTAHLLVTRGATSFTLDITGAASPNHCIAGIQVTPAS